MGVALIPVFEGGQIDPWLTIDCKRLARSMDDLVKLSKKLRRPDLWSFLSCSLVEREAHEEEIAGELQKQRSWISRRVRHWLKLDEPIHQVWYEPEAGLRAVGPLVEYLHANPRAVSDAAVLEELQALRVLLIQASSQGIRWHFEQDT